MSFLDLYQGDQREAMRPAPNEGHDLPATFGESFHAAWDNGRLFEQSTAHENARMEALQDYLGSIKEKSGVDVSPQMDWTVDAPGVGAVPNASAALLGQANAAVTKLKGARPDLNFDPLDDAGLDKAAIEKSRAAGKAVADISGREHSGLGLFAGAAASAATDPINILALPVAPETAGVGIVAAALRWGAVGALAQTGIEAAGDAYREDVQPGYLQSGAPLANVVEAFGGGAVLGGATRFLGNLWTRAKTGAWPTSIKDAGNVLESEANVLNHNVYEAPSPVPEGHTRFYHGGSSDADPTSGGGRWVTQDYNYAKGWARDGGVVHYVEIPNDHPGLLKRFDDTGTDQVSPFADFEAPEDIAKRMKPYVDGARTEAAHRDAMATSVDQVLKGEPVDVSKIITPEIEASARDAAAGPAEAGDESKPAALGAESSVAEKSLESPARPAEVPPFEATERPAVAATEQTRAMLESGDHEAALQADIDRERVTDVSRQIPVDVDKDGNVVYRSLDSMADEAEAYRKVSEQIAGCAAPAAPEEPA